jgi:hypothetical protein
VIGDRARNMQIEAPAALGNGGLSDCSIIRVCVVPPASQVTMFSRCLSCEAFLSKVLV